MSDITTQQGKGSARMPRADLGDITLHYREDGPPDGAPLVFANALGTDLTLWDRIVPLLPAGLRVIRYDMRGQGASDCPPAPYSMGALVRDAERLLDHLDLRDCVFVGLSLGGMVAQGLAVKRLDQLRALVLCNTAAKIGQPAMWHDRIETLRKGDMAAWAEATLERWFSARIGNTDPRIDAVREMLLRARPEGCMGACAAIAGTDFYTPTSGLRLPTLGIACAEDRATPPDLVRETVNLVPGARVQLLRRAGHLPCIDQPEAMAEALGTFLGEIGHV